MVNSNPETVSTDYDTSDHLFFEPLTAEDVLNICDRMQPEGVIVQFGGQTPLNLAKALEAAGAPIIGTSVDSIDIAEDRERFQELVERLGLQQPANGTALDLQQATARRPRDRLSRAGAAQLRARRPGHGDRLRRDSRCSATCEQAMEVSPGKPILIDKFLESAIEVDVDCLSDGQRTIIGGVMQHIEEAGIHSGDSACVIPPHSLPAGRHRGDQAADPRAGPELERQGPDEHAVRRPADQRCGRTAERSIGPSSSTSSKSTRAPAARCRSCPRRPACRWPATRRWSWSARRWTSWG